MSGGAICRRAALAVAMPEAAALVAGRSALLASGCCPTVGRPVLGRRVSRRRVVDLAAGAYRIIVEPAWRHCCDCAAGAASVCSAASSHGLGCTHDAPSPASPAAAQICSSTTALATRLMGRSTSWAAAPSAARLGSRSFGSSGSEFS